MKECPQLLRNRDEIRTQRFPGKETELMKIAVVRNRENGGVINRFGQICPEIYGEKSVQLVVDALRSCDHSVALLEADKNLLPRLETFMPADVDGRPTGMVFNLAYGIQGECRYTHVPAMLELAGVPYTGSSPLGHALALDKVITKNLMRQADVPTPEYRVMGRAEVNGDGLHFPLIVKPRHESTSFGMRLVQNEAELSAAVAAIVAQFQQEALVEEYIEGREICVGLLGNDEIEVLPFVETDFGGRVPRLVTWEDKNHLSAAPLGKICPAPVEEKLAAKLREISVNTFRACRCKDYSRVDIRIDRAGNPYVLEINSMASLGAGASYVFAAQVARYTYPALVNRILDVAHQRYFGIPVPRPSVIDPVGPTPQDKQAMLA
jgi:D-alanine-D-alanine ligase